MTLWPDIADLARCRRAAGGGLGRQLGVVTGTTHMVEFAFVGTGITAIGSHHTTLGTRRRTAPPAFSRAAPASVAGRLGTAGLRQRDGGLGADTGAHDRYGRPQGYAQALAGRWRRSDVSDLRHAGSCGGAASTTSHAAVPRWIPPASTRASSRGRAHTTSPGFASALATRSCRATAIRGSPIR